MIDPTKKRWNQPGQDVEPASYRIHPTVAPRPGETVIGKHHANAFRDTALLEHLREDDWSELVVVGMQTHMCVEAAARAAGDLGFEVIVIHDACATRALTFGETKTSAEDVHNATLSALSGSYAKVIDTNSYLSEYGSDD